MGSVPLADLEALYRSEYRRFLRVATAILRDETRAVDAVQEAFASALRRQRQFRGDGRSKPGSGEWSSTLRSRSEAGKGIQS